MRNPAMLESSKAPAVAERPHGNGPEVKRARCYNKIRTNQTEFLSGSNFFPASPHKTSIQPYASLLFQKSDKPVEVVK